MPYLHQTLTRIFHQNAHRLKESSDPCKQLTKRGREVLSPMATGMSNRAIAEKLSCSELTIQNHAHAVFKKLGVRNRVAAVASGNRMSSVLSFDNDRADSASQTDAPDVNERMIRQA
jgi:DNA-binding NarL/FixJ family response regulator